MRLRPLSTLIQAALTVVLMVAPVSAAQPASVLIENVTVVSPEREAPLRGAFVLIEEGTIRSVGAARPAIPKEKKVQVLDGRGRFLVPGLIDSHVHVGMPPGIGVVTADFEKRHGEMLAAFWKQLPRSYLYHGVTTLVDLASGPIAAGHFRSALAAPDLVTCAPLTLERGYPAVLLPPGSGQVLPYTLPDNPEEAVRLVRSLQKDGHRCIKLFFEDGFGDASHLPLPAERVVTAVRAEARRLGLPVVIHANALDMQMLALRYQPDVLAHGLWGWGASTGAPGLPEPIRKHLDAVVASGTAYQPTFGVVDGLVHLFDPAFLDDPALKKVVPPGLLAWYRTDEAQFFKKEIAAETPAFADPAVARRIFEEAASQAERALTYLARNGGKVLLGSDTPSAPTWTDQPGLNSWRELQHMSRAGLAPRDLLRAATLRNAEVFGLRDLGTIEPGKTANLLLLRADPLVSVDAWNEIESVVLHGQVLPRESLAVPGS